MYSLLSRLKYFNDLLKDSNRFRFTLILTFALYFVAIAFNFLFNFIKEKDVIWIRFPGEKMSGIVFFITTIVVSPFIETFLNQYLPYLFLGKIKYFRERSYFILLCSAILFGLMHFYSLFYIFYAFLIGLILMYGYMIRISRDKATFYLISLCHSLLNCGIFLLRYINN